MQALFDNAQIKRGIMRHKRTGGEERFDFLPELRKNGGVCHNALIDPGQLRVEPVKRLLRVDIGEKGIRDEPGLHDGDTDRAHAVVVPVRGLHIKNNKT